MRGQPSQTAEGVCWMRAAERRRKPAERIVDDPYAKFFLGPMLRATLNAWEASGVLGDLAELFSPGLITFVLCRHRYIDDCLRRALAGNLEQVVILGAGYDTRAYRLAQEINHRPVFEVDHPATSRRKARILAVRKSELPVANVRVVEVDFERDSLRERLREVGFQRGLRTFFVWEGVAMYLTREAVKNTLGELRELAAAGSEIAMDLWHLPEGTDFAAAARAASALYWIAEPVLFAIHPEDAPALLGRLGYRVIEVADAALLRSRCVRDQRRVYGTGYLVHASTRSTETAETGDSAALEEGTK